MTLDGSAPSDDDIDGERFRTVGRRGLALSVFLPFRFMHPPLLIPRAAVERCEEVRPGRRVRRIGSRALTPNGRATIVGPWDCSQFARR